MEKPGVGVLLLSLSMGCAAQRYGFRPTGSVLTAEAGYPASHYDVPPEAPVGEVFVTSFGTRDVDTAGGPGGQLIHVRLAVSNRNSASDWTIDPAKQLLVAPGVQPQRPDFMEIDGRHDGDTRLGRGQRKVLDLYYRMPGGVRDASHLGGFDLQWQIDGGGQAFAEHTPFVREPYRGYEEGSRTEVGVVGLASPWWAYGYGPLWWGGFGLGYYGFWGYPRYGYGPYGGGYYGYGRHGGYRPYYSGGGYSRGGGAGAIRAPAVRGRRP